MQGVFIVLVALLTLNYGLQGILADAPGAAKFNGFDNILGRLSRLSSAWGFGLGRGHILNVLLGRLGRGLRNSLERIRFVGLRGRLLRRGLLLRRRLLLSGRLLCFEKYSRGGKDT